MTLPAPLECSGISRNIHLPSDMKTVARFCSVLTSLVLPNMPQGIEPRLGHSEDEVRDGYGESIEGLSWVMWDDEGCDGAFCVFVCICSWTDFREKN